MKLLKKVFGIGLNKTGTTTLGACLTHLGYRHCSYRADLVIALREHHSLDEIYQTADQYDSFEDWPWPLVYKELDQRYPDAQFILTMRRTPEVWLDSLLRHAERVKDASSLRNRRLTYGFEMPHGHEKDLLTRYHEHNAQVTEYFSSRPGKLLTIFWEKEDGWQKLCEFLRMPVPDVPLPHLNRRPDEAAHKPHVIRKPGLVKGLIQKIF